MPCLVAEPNTKNIIRTPQIFAKCKHQLKISFQKFESPFSQLAFTQIMWSHVCPFSACTQSHFFTLSSSGLSVWTTILSLLYEIFQGLLQWFAAILRTDLTMLSLMFSMSLNSCNMSYHFYDCLHKISVLFLASWTVCLCVFECKDH